MPEPVEPWFVYVLRCKGERLYCGIAKDVDARFAEHVAGKGAKFTRAFPPEAIVATKPCDSRSAALRSEAGFKRLKKVQKLAWLKESS
ncbi:MAG: GIY-YIG nuclease family protein [Silanimonas sp.]